ncbi:MAG: hypothetical protein EXR36_14095 [Betaproteobacteria bacterium]|nr:hypothetical protein [Betaproteobacteria bacterium]
MGASEIVSGVLTRMEVPHQVLNARQDREEAEVVARVGQLGLVTVATNMAGRVTDIRLSDEAKQRGGLHVVLTEYHESSRIDRQLFGRCARQGDPGTAQGFASLEDELFVRFASWPASLLRVRPGLVESMSPWLARLLVKIAQWNAERMNAHICKQSVKHDRRMEKLTAMAGRGE